VSIIVEEVLSHLPSGAGRIVGIQMYNGDTLLLATEYALYRISMNAWPFDIGKVQCIRNDG